MHIPSHTATPNAIRRLRARRCFRRSAPALIALAALAAAAALRGPSGALAAALLLCHIALFAWAWLQYRRCQTARARLEGELRARSAALEEREKKYQALFEQSGDVIYITTPDGALVDINQAGLRLLGYDSIDEMRALDIARDLYVDAEERERFKRLMEQHGAVRDMETTRRHKDGRVLTLLETAAAVRDEQGRIVAYQGFLRDITERRQAEETLRQVIASARCLLWEASVKPRPGAPGEFSWQTTVSNEEAAQAFLPLNVQPGQTYTDAWYQSKFPGDHEAMDRRSSAAILAGLSGYSQEFRCRRADGAIRWLFEDVWIEQIAPSCWRLVGVCTDVTERKTAEQELLSSRNELVERIAELEQRSREIALLNEMGERLHSCFTEEEVYRAVEGSLRQLFEGDAGALYVRDQATGLLRVVAAWGRVMVDQPPGVPEACLAMGFGQAHDCAPAHEGAEPACAGPGCPHAAGAPGAATICTPLIAQGEALGVLRLHRGAEGLDAARRLVVTVAEHIALALANLRLREMLRHQAIHDALTGLFNRRYMEESLEREIRHAMRHALPLGIIMLDLDHFKRFNDGFGHAAGDTLLRELGAFLLGRIRAEDIACRYGGEEFILILRESSLEDTRRRAEQICAQARELRVKHRHISLNPISLSLGVAALPEHGTTVEELLHAADEALYRAKQLGRDRVVVSPTRISEADTRVYG